ncbi:MAG: M23 family metallopeptidase [Defluviitaleaceae bacterium]|nr:M23 family metallopeptidase [Defluviitaleaceae bacterium]
MKKYLALASCLAFLACCCCSIASIGPAENAGAPEATPVLQAETETQPPSEPAINVPSPTPVATATPSPQPTPIPEPTPTPTPIPEPVASLSNYAPAQGQVFGFTMTNPKPGSAYELNDSHFAAPIFPFYHDGSLAALIPIETNVSTGRHNLCVNEITDGVSTELFMIEYDVLRSEFTRQDLTVTQETASLMTDSNLRSDRAKIAAAKETTSPAPLWEGVFLQPLEGRITTMFGQVRYTNGNYTSRHDAFDIAAPEGTDVYAAAAGRVVLADGLFISGNAVIIDHGLWLFTHYYHLSEILVEAGDFVSAGDIIGKVGTTGYSTGPHLHYAAMVGTSSVNPDHLKTEPLFGP